MPNVHDEMNVIRHNNPRLHPILVSIAFEQNHLDKFRHISAAQPALAMTSIQPRFKFPALHRIIRLFQNRLKFRAVRDRKGILELKGDELGDARRVEVRQITALMPAAKAFLQFRDGWLPTRFAFGADEFEQAKILWRTAADWFRRFHRARSAAFMP